tara:strand:+ start:222 stop:734 length:513 start_codon:yes stop_codon:yes gene_type:complete
MDEILTKAIDAKNRLISNMNTIIISSVCKENNPNASYAPSVVGNDKNFYIYISSLSKHTKNLINNPRASIMIIEDESASENIFGRKRLTMNAIPIRVKRDSETWTSTIKLMEAKFGETVTFLKDMTDFNMFKLVPQDGLLVHGFARAFRFEGEGLSNISYLNDKGHTQKK